MECSYLYTICSGRALNDYLYGNRIIQYRGFKQKSRLSSSKKISYYMQEIAVSDKSRNVSILIIYLLASFSNILHAIFQDVAFYQIWPASVFHETLSQLPGFCNPIDTSPLCSPTFLVFKENPFITYTIPYFTDINRITLLV